MDNEYLRFGRKNFDNFMRFGRAAHVPSEAGGNNLLDTFGNEDDFQILHRQEPNPFPTIGRLNDHGNIEDDLEESVPSVGRRSRDPFLRFGRNVSYLRFGRNVPYLRFGRNVPYLRFGRNVPYLRFGRSNYPYLRFGRSSPSLTSQAVESLPSFEKSGEALQQADDDVAILTGSPGLGEESYSTDRKKRSVDTQLQDTLVHGKGCVASTDSSDIETANTTLDQVDIRASRANPYMRFGKRNDQPNSDNNKHYWDKDLELYVKNQADKRKQEYMRFGRAK